MAFFLLVACGTNASSADTAVAFETPISNQVEVHDGSEHAGADHASDEQGSAAHAEQEHEGEGEDHTHLDPAQATAEMGVALVPSELVVGANRFAVGLFVGEGQVVHDAEVHFHYFELTNPDAPVLEAHAEATRQQTPDGLTTIFTQDRNFARAGD